MLTRDYVNESLDIVATAFTQFGEPVSGCLEYSKSEFTVFINKTSNLVNGMSTVLIDTKNNKVAAAFICDDLAAPQDFIMDEIPSKC